VKRKSLKYYSLGGIVRPVLYVYGGVEPRGQNSYLVCLCKNEYGMTGLFCSESMIRLSIGLVLIWNRL